MTQLTKASQPDTGPAAAARQLYRSTFPEWFRRRVRKILLRMVKHNRVIIPSISVANLMADARKNLAAWNLDAALSSIEQVLKIEPVHQRALQLRANILGHLGQYESSAAAAEHTLKIYPTDVPSRRQLKALGRQVPVASREIALAFARSKSFRPTICAQCAAYLFDAELFVEAVELCELGLAAAGGQERSERVAMTVTDLKLQMAVALEANGNYPQALALFRELISDQRVAKKASEGLARCLLDQGQPERAQVMIEASNAGQRDPIPFSPLAIDVYQAQRKVAESYLLYRKRPLSRAMARAFGKSANPEDLRILDPENKSRSALIVMEGGPGDELRFSTLFNDLSRAFGDLTITCDPRLEGVLRRSYPQIRFLPVPRLRREFVRDASDRMNLPDALLFQCVSDEVIQRARSADIACSILDTLYDIGPGTEAFQGSVSTIQSDPIIVGACSKRNPGGVPRIGIAWRSILQSVARNRHYLSVEQLAPLQKLSDCEFWLLQPGATNEEIAAIRELVDLHVPDVDLRDDFESQIALITELDAVISPFTTTAELAGACGVPSYLLSTSRNTRWRRQPNGADIWHQSARIVVGEGADHKLNACTKAANELENYLRR